MCIILTFIIVIFMFKNLTIRLICSIIVFSSQLQGFVVVGLPLSSEIKKFMETLEVCNFKDVGQFNTILQLYHNLSNKDKQAIMTRFHKNIFASTLNPDIYGKLAVLNVTTPSTCLNSYHQNKQALENPLPSKPDNNSQVNENEKSTKASNTSLVATPVASLESRSSLEEEEENKKSRTLYAIISDPKFPYKKAVIIGGGLVCLITLAIILPILPKTAGGK